MWGSGTRLWPESRGVRAKQFLPLTGPKSLFEQTTQRTPTGANFSPPADEALAGAIRDGGALHADAMAFARAPADSIDYAVMEKDRQVAVVPVRMGWSDMGSWNAVHTATAGKDAAANAASGDVLFQDCQGNLVRSGGKRVSLIGMRDIVVVVDGDDILVMPLACSQDIRSLAMARENENR